APVWVKCGLAHKQGRSDSIREPHQSVPKVGLNAQSYRNQTRPSQGQEVKRATGRNSCCSPRAVPRARAIPEIRKAAKVRRGSRQRRCSHRQEDKARHPKRPAGPSTEKPSRGRRKLKETPYERAPIPPGRGRIRQPKGADRLWRGR